MLKAFLFRRLSVIVVRLLMFHSLVCVQSEDAKGEGFNKHGALRDKLQLAEVRPHQTIAGTRKGPLTDPLCSLLRCKWPSRQTWAKTTRCMTASRIWVSFSRVLVCL